MKHVSALQILDLVSMMICMQNTACAQPQLLQLSILPLHQHEKQEWDAKAYPRAPKNAYQHTSIDYFGVFLA